MKRILSLGLLLAGCAQQPPTAEDIQAKKFAPVPDRAVIYVARAPGDALDPGMLQVDTGEQIATMNGTYHRLEVTPGTRQIWGVGPLGNNVTMTVEPEKIYFLRLRVFGDGRGATSETLQVVDEREGRRLVEQSQLFP
jgi:hypothetical protein